MQVEKMQEFMDGGLDEAERREMEALIASDPQAARLHAALKVQFSLRAAAFETYLPTKHESAALASQVMAAAYAPVGRVGYWVRRGAAVAAAFIIVAGTFAAGRMTAPAPQPIVTVQERQVTKTVYDVTSIDLRGETSVHEFASAEDRDTFVKELDQTGGKVIEVAAITLPGQL